jgi:hypothetical protein
MRTKFAAHGVSTPVDGAQAAASTRCFGNRLKSLISEPTSHHQAAHCHVEERLAGLGHPLVVLAHPAVLARPRKAPLHYPSPREDIEILRIGRWLLTFWHPYPAPGALDDLRRETQDLLHPVLARPPANSAGRLYRGRPGRRAGSTASKTGWYAARSTSASAARYSSALARRSRSK